MSLRTHLNLIANDDRLTRGLDDAEARMLIDWLVARVEALYARDANGRRIETTVQRWRLRARAIARFVSLWCHEHLFGPALQLAATERFAWPLPAGPMDACDLLGEILAWEDEKRRAGRI